MTLNPTAICPCGYAITVTEAQDGQTLYGTLADEMGTHESACQIIQAEKEWMFDHSENVIEGTVNPRTL